MLTRLNVLWIAALVLFLPPALRSEAPACYRDIERSFFRPELVSQALSFQISIPQNTWTPINTALGRNAGQVPKIVRERAAKLHPNPFDTPFDAEIAEQLLTQALVEVLAKTLVQYNITHPGVVREIFLYIQAQQIKKWTACFPKDEHKEAHK